MINSELDFHIISPCLGLKYLLVLHSHHGTSMNSKGKILDYFKVLKFDNPIYSNITRFSEIIILEFVF